MKLRLPNWSQARVLVVGDVMLDRYWHGATSRISPEAPVPVVHVNTVEERVGGAGNVALNVASLGARAAVMGVIGEDEAAAALKRALSAHGVEGLLEQRPGFPTVTKLRVLSRHQQLIRLDFEDAAEPVTGADLSARLRQALPDSGVVVCSDYGKGTLRQVADLIAAAREAERPVLIDPKGRDFSKYRNATLITPNMSEFEGVVGACETLEQVTERGLNLIRDLSLEALLVTRGEHGMTLLQPGAEPLHLAAEAREVYDVTGAGDTVIAVLAAALAAGEPLPTATALANVAAGIVVGKLGTATVTQAELHHALQEHHYSRVGVLTEEELLAVVGEARRRGETIVMTNGCFDILHAGHVQYLEQARRLGDRLIVAVNDDASVRRLKGAGRPINPVDQRMTVLAALGSVDWVVPFNEETPQRLICRVVPDVLVKGGDYTADQVAGGDCVRQAGGEVVILDFKPGCSTSSVIEAIRRL